MQIRTNPIALSIVFITFFMILYFNCYYLFNFDDANIQQVSGFAKF